MPQTNFVLRCYQIPISKKTVQASSSWGTGKACIRRLQADEPDSPGLGSFGAVGVTHASPRTVKIVSANPRVLRNSANARRGHLSPSNVRWHGQASFPSQALRVAGSGNGRGLCGLKVPCNVTCPSLSLTSWPGLSHPRSAWFGGSNNWLGRMSTRCYRYRIRVCIRMSP